MALTQVSDNGLTSTGVTAATYGSSSAIPSLTIDAKGRVTSATTSAIDSTSISNGTSNVSVSNNGDILMTRGGVQHSRFDASGMKFNDGRRIAFGNAFDLTIQHNGTDSIIADTGTGDLYIRGSNNIFLEKGDGTETFLRTTDDGAVDLYYDNSRKFSTASDGVSVVGNLGLGDGGVIACGQSSDLRIQHSGSNSFVETSTNSTGDLYVISQGTNHDLYLQANDDIFIRPANGEAGIVVNGNGAVELYYDGQMRFETNASAVTMRGGGYHRCEGHFRPWSNNTYDLGTSGDRWRNVYTNDLHLSNEGSANDVDGTWGNYTIQEGEDDLFLINRRSGKKYKFNLTEVN